MDIPFIGSLSHNSLTDPTMAVDKEKPAGSPPNTFVPGRNLFFISIAAVYARERGIYDLVTGVSQVDFSGYPDCRDSFVRSLNVTMNLAMDEQFVIHTPLMWMDKCEVWALADELGVMDIVAADTVTCLSAGLGSSITTLSAETLTMAAVESAPVLAAVRYTVRMALQSL
jgi:7-cyano-7-deazaguanine synthase